MSTIADVAAVAASVGKLVASALEIAKAAEDRGQDPAEAVEALHRRMRQIHEEFEAEIAEKFGGGT